MLKANCYLCIKELPMKKLVELNLPEFAFVEGSMHENPDILKGRDVILHVRSASIVEILERDNVILKDGVVKHNFVNTNKYGIREKLVAVLHFSATFDDKDDYGEIIEKVLKPAAKWYCDYADWEDEQGDDILPEDLLL